MHIIFCTISNTLNNDESYHRKDIQTVINLRKSYIYVYTLHGDKMNWKQWQGMNCYTTSTMLHFFIYLIYCLLYVKCMHIKWIMFKYIKEKKTINLKKLW